MTNPIKTRLLSGVAVAALSFMVASPASAFDTVNWTWDADVTETVTKTVVVDINLAPTGMVMVEDLQVQIGDVSAESIVSGIDNNQPAGGGVVDAGTLDITFQYGLDGNQIDNEFKSPEVIVGNVDETSVGEFGNGTVTATLDLGEIEIPPTESFDALTELPSVTSAATAVANNTSISSDVVLELHEGQFAFNVGNNDTSGRGGLSLDDAPSGNSNLTIAAVLGALAINGNLVPSEVSAVSDVSDILNATVDSSATAVVNNLTVDVTPVSGDDALVIADIVQFAFANVSATSTVSDVSINSYTNLGLIDGPIVSSVATAVGNNKAITVGNPVVVVQP